jgi:D-alanine transaminase
VTRIAYVNGEFLPLEHARVSVLDRGFLFADGVYEVSAVIDGRLVDNDAHLARLERSLAEIDLQRPADRTRLTTIQAELVRRNELQEGLVYIQVTRGVADRDFAFPKDAAPSLIMFTQAKRILDTPQAETGIKVISVPEIRWQRRDIKSVALLPQVLARQEAVEAGAQEAWMVENGYVTEGASSSAFIITKAGAIVTRPLSNEILAGITRQAVLRLAQEASLDLEERRFSLAEAYDAAEAFITSASNFIMPVVRIDGRAVGGAVPGPLTRRLRQLYLAFARGETMPALAAAAAESGAALQA